jgi:hypothetical protein
MARPRNPGALVRAAIAVNAAGKAAGKAGRTRP